MLNNLRFGSGELYLIEDDKEISIWAIKNIEIQTDKEMQEILWDNTLYLKSQNKKVDITWELYNFNLDILNRLENYDSNNDVFEINWQAKNINFLKMKIVNKWTDYNLAFNWYKCYLNSGFKTRFNEIGKEIYIPIKFTCLNDEQNRIISIKKEL